MQTQAYAGPFTDHTPDYAGVGWSSYGVSESHIDSDDATGYLSSDLTGRATLAHAMLYDDGVIPSLSNIRTVRVRYRLGDTALVTQGLLAAVPYVRYEDGPPVFQELFQPPYADSFADYDIDFPRDPDGLPWTRATIYAKRGKLLRFGLLVGLSDLVSAELLWSECRFIVDFDLPVPIVVTDPASLIADSSALLNGRINPRGANASYPLTWWFEYGTTTDYGSQTTPVANVTGDVDLVVSSPVTGLGVGIGYHFRLVAETSDGKVYGEDRFFTTDPTATGRFRLDEFKRLPTGEWLPGDRTRMTSPGFDRPSTATDDLSCPFLRFP